MNEDRDPIDALADIANVDITAWGREDKERLVAYFGWRWMGMDSAQAKEMVMKQYGDFSLHARGDEGQAI